jgi:hypothetical protein
MTNAVPEVIMDRVNDGRPTWVTTWMTPEQVAQRYGDGIARRLYEAGRVVVIGCGGSALGLDGSPGPPHRVATSSSGCQGRGSGR